jgi:hypothetical protein
MRKLENQLRKLMNIENKLLKEMAKMKMLLLPHIEKGFEFEVIQQSGDSFCLLNDRQNIPISAVLPLIKNRSTVISARNLMIESI